MNINKDKKSHIKSSKKYRKKNPEKIIAHRLISQIQISKGQLCQICNKRLAKHKHHDDYSKPYEVWFCCSICHSEIDKQRKAREEKW